MSNYFSDKMIELQEMKNNVVGRIQQLDEDEEFFKKTIQQHIKGSKETDEQGDTWINSDALLEDLGLSEWNPNRNQHIKEDK